MKIDDLDIKLLRLLQLDASLTFQQLADLTHASVPTCQRRVTRLRSAGVIQKIVAVLSPDLVKSQLTAILEVTLTSQDAETVGRFAMAMASVDALQQCYRVSTGPDFVLIVTVSDMPAYHDFAQRHLTAVNSVRNVRTFFCIDRVKFDTAIPLPH